MDIENELQRIAEVILAENPEPIIKYKLLKEVLNVSSNELDCEISIVTEKNKWIQLLQKEQWSDGSWGRLHSRDTKRKQLIYTTELGVRKAILMGLNDQHPIVKSALEYLIENISKGVCRDPPEKNARWPIGIKLFFASTIAIIDSSHVSISLIVKSWVQILEETFKTGKYVDEHEKMAHKEIFELDYDLKFLHLNYIYSYQDHLSKTI